MKQLKIWILTACWQLCFMVNAAGQLLSYNDIDLTWKDFTEVNTISHTGATAVLHTNSGLGYSTTTNSHGISLEISLELKRDAKKSLVKKSFMKNASTTDKELLLTHEKGHLIVALVHFKMLCDAIKAFNFTENYKAEITHLKDSIYRRQEEMNLLYDRETNHHINRAAQREWDKKLLVLFNDNYTDTKEIKYTFEHKLVIKKQ